MGSYGRVHAQTVGHCFKTNSGLEKHGTDSQHPNDILVPRQVVVHKNQHNCNGLLSRKQYNTNKHNSQLQGLQLLTLVQALMTIKKQVLFLTLREGFLYFYCLNSTVSKKVG